MTQNALARRAPEHGDIGDSAPLTPMSLGTLLNRVSNEFASRNRIFDLPTGRYWSPDSEVDLSFEFLGRKAATPVGPAAGPHSQLAQNIALSWLGGSRLFELKTVQILDELEIARPCIDMATIGYNIEWSQELTLGQSLTEYAKASMLLEILSRWEPLQAHVGPQPGPYVFDMSVGYDLAGISNPRVAAFISGMGDASAEIEAMRAEIPDSFAQFRDFDFTTTLSDTLTLSTFHGCPPGEIEAITKHLIDVHDLDVIVKLNPTLLGYETVADIVNDQLGYHDVDVKEEAFAEDLQFDRGIELIGELNQYAKDRGHRFGIKLTNTLVVNNAKQWMPEDTMYLSGPPLHVLAMTLLDRLSQALPDMLDIPGHGQNLTESPTEASTKTPTEKAEQIMVSFSAGVCKENLADSIAAGVNPATVCSDLLKPGGYGRLAPMLKALTNELRDSGCRDLPSWRQQRQALAQAAGHKTTAAEHVARITGDDRQRYHRDGNDKPPREVDSELEMFGCVACNFCVTVCPNDAFFAVPTPEPPTPEPPTPESPTPDEISDGMAELPGRQQYLLFAELCNECGNCMTFCPEDGDPAMIKPRLFTDESVFYSRTGQGFLLGDKSLAEGSLIGRAGNDERADDAITRQVERLLNSTKGNPLGGERS